MDDCLQSLAIYTLLRLEKKNATVLDKHLCRDPFGLGFQTDSAGAAKGLGSTLRGRSSCNLRM